MATMFQKGEQWRGKIFAPRTMLGLPMFLLPQSSPSLVREQQLCEENRPQDDELEPRNKRESLLYRFPRPCKRGEEHRQRDRRQQRGAHLSSWERSSSRLCPQQRRPFSPSLHPPDFALIISLLLLSLPAFSAKETLSAEVSEKPEKPVIRQPKRLTEKCWETFEKAFMNEKMNPSKDDNSCHNVYVDVGVHLSDCLYKAIHLGNETEEWLTKYKPQDSFSYERGYRKDGQRIKLEYHWNISMIPCLLFTKKTVNGTSISKLTLRAHYQAPEVLWEIQAISDELDGKAKPLQFCLLNDKRVVNMDLKNAIYPSIEMFEAVEKAQKGVSHRLAKEYSVEKICSEAWRLVDASKYRGNAELFPGWGNAGRGLTKVIEGAGSTRKFRHRFFWDASSSTPTLHRKYYFYDSDSDDDIDLEEKKKKKKSVQGTMAVSSPSEENGKLTGSMLNPLIGLCALLVVSLIFFHTQHQRVNKCANKKLELQKRVLRGKS